LGDRDRLRQGGVMIFADKMACGQWKTIGLNHFPPRDVLVFDLLHWIH
jgi:hypothetical protein